MFKPVQKKEKGKKGQEKEIERERGASMKYRKRKVNERESEAKVRRFGGERRGKWRGVKCLVGAGNPLN